MILMQTLKYRKIIIIQHSIRVDIEQKFLHITVAFIFMNSIFSLTIGIPILVIEVATGQLTGGMLNYYWFCPLLRGLEVFYSMMNMWVQFTYLFNVSIAVLYLSYCFESVLPWESCKEPWRTESE